MILKGNARGGAKDLALHLMKDENEHVALHELRGFTSDNLMGALNEAYAMSRGTKCQKFLYSLSLSPPPQENVSTAEFEAAIDRIEDRLGLSGQPRAIVFHEKEGPGGIRRHAHAVWSRIRADDMKAAQLSHDRMKLKEISRELYIEHGWSMPRGLAHKPERDPRNFTLEQWQQARRGGKDARAIKAAFQDAWAISDSRAAFAQALEERGYKLAKGERRGFVGIDRNGEIYAVAKWAGIKTKDVRARLGDEHTLPSLEARRQEFAREVSHRLNAIKHEQDVLFARKRAQMEAERLDLVKRHSAARRMLDERQQLRWRQETLQRQQRFSSGMRGLFERLSGKRKRIEARNEQEALEALRRDRAEKDTLISRQLEQRRALQQRVLAQREQQQALMRELKADIRERSSSPETTLKERRKEFMRRRESLPRKRERSRGPTLER